MSVTLSASNFNGVLVNGTSSPTVTIPTDVPSGATLILCMVWRTSEADVVTEVSDPVNGSWTQRQTADDAGGTAQRSYYYTFMNSAALTGAGNRLVTISSSTSGNWALTVGWISSSLGAMTFDGMATVVQYSTNATAWASNTFAAAGAGAIVGGMGCVNTQGTTHPTADGAGESILGPNPSVSGLRAFCHGESYGASGSYGLTSTVGSSRGNWHVGAFLEPATGGGGSPAFRLSLLGVGR